MSSLDDEQLLQHGKRSEGKVVLITGMRGSVDVAGIPH